MPIINLPKKKKSTFHSQTDKRELRKKAYNNTKWRKTRDAYIHEHPLCEECLKQGRIYGGGGDRGDIHVHHKVSPFKGNKIDMELLLDSNNLMTLCSKCHGEIHSKKEMSASEMLEMLEQILADPVEFERQAEIEAAMAITKPMFDNIDNAEIVPIIDDED